MKKPRKNSVKYLQSELRKANRTVKGLTKLVTLMNISYSELKHRYDATLRSHYADGC